MTPDFLQRLDRLTSLVETLAKQQAIKPSWYSVSEFAVLVHKSPFTVRQWCNLGRINAIKSEGRCGPEHEWVINAEELRRYQQHRLLPANPKRNNPDRAA